MSQVKSTYNFVPAPTEDQVFKPDWADKVSHDIPFEDGESGEIEVVITAETPIFIREGISAKEAKIKQEKGIAFKFSHYYDQEGKPNYFIPATSLKGMLRSTIEILSFSRMSQVDSSTIFGLRDMNNDNYSKVEMRNNQTGWLIKNGGEWLIQPCHHDRVKISTIKAVLLPGKEIAFDQITAVEKYKALNFKKFTNNNYCDNLIEIDKTGNVYDLVDYETDAKGYLVLFGSMNNKKYDYIFHEADEQKKYILKNNKDGKCDLLKRILDIEKNNENSLWNYFINDLELKKIPVFFKIDNGQVKHFGFSKLYRQNNGHYLNEIEPLKSILDAKNQVIEFNKNEKKRENYQKYKHDLSSLLFGHTFEDDSLKGRVFISNAKQIEDNGETDIEERILSTPNPSYYPNYLEQINPKNEYSTYVDGKISLKGFKRYPVHTSIKNGDLVNESMISKFKPLAKGNTFSFKIRFHNLKRAEIGALISAITHHNSGNSYHSIGGGRPYGFGKIKLNVNSNNVNWFDYLYYFEKIMDTHTHKLNLGSWINTSQVKEILSLSKNPENNVDVNLKYPVLELKGVQAKEANEFNNFKKEKLYLKNYSEINGIVKVNSTIKDFEDKLVIKNKLKKDESRLLIDKAYEYLQLDNFDLAISTYNSALEIFDDNSLPKFLEQIEIRKKEKIELDAYNLSIENATLEGFDRFNSNFPFSKFKDDVNQRISKLKATSGVPGRLISLKESDKFFKEGDQWIKKLPNKQLIGSGFENEIEAKISAIGLVEMLNAKTSAKWLNGIYLKKIIEWFGETKAKEIISQISKR